LRRGGEFSIIPSGEFYTIDDKLYPSTRELESFQKNTVAHVQPPPGYTGPEKVGYRPYGHSVHVDNINRLSDAVLCRHDEEGATALKQAEEGSVCARMARAIRAHEEHHPALCRQMGYRAYQTIHGADLAWDEVEAYGIQIAVLRAEIDQLKWNCDYRVTQQVQYGDVRGLKCDGPAGEWNIHIETPIDWGTVTSDFAILIDRNSLRGSYNNITKLPMHDGSICINTSTGDAAFFDNESPWFDLSFGRGLFRCESGRPPLQGGYRGLSGSMKSGPTELPPLESGEFCSR
jgi:hypothetical protein